MYFKTRYFFTFVTVFFLAILTTACGGANMASQDRASEVYYAAEEPAMAPAPSSSTSSGGNSDDSSTVVLENLQAKAISQAQDNRVIIYTGDISLVVKDTQEAIKAITALAEGQEGFVAGSNAYQSGDVLRGSITIRVPAQNYQATLSQLRDLAIRVERESASTQDVTEEFVDLQARKTNLEFTEKALQELLDERQNIGKTSDILEVHRELTTIRGQIEQIDGRLRYLANQAALSTITIELIPDVLYQPISIAGWEPQGVAKEAVQALVVALQGLVNVLIWLVIFVLPLLIILLLPVAILALIIRWGWKRRNKGKQKQPPPQSATADKTE